MAMIGRRPSASAKWPEMGETTRARKEVLDAMRDLSHVVVGREREFPREIRIDDMTPVLFYRVSMGYRHIVVVRCSLVTEQKTADARAQC